MNQKRKQGVNRKLKQEDAIINTSFSCTTNVIDDINPSDLQSFCDQWKNKKYCACMRAYYENWYTMWLCFDLDEENHATHIFKRVRVFKLVNGRCLACSCNLFEHIGVVCVHISKIVNEISVYFWHAIHWKSCNFYYLREGTSDFMNNMCEILAFTNKTLGACWDNVPSCQNYTFLSSNDVAPSHFTEVLESEWPIVLNCPFEWIKKQWKFRTWMI